MAIPTKNSAKVKVGTYPFAIAINPNINQIYVANAGSNTVSVIDGNTNNVTQVKVGFNPGFNPRAIAVNPNTNKIYLGSGGSNIVSVIDARTKNVTQVKVGFGTQTGMASIPHISINPGTNKIYVIYSRSNDAVSVINGNTNNVTQVKVGLFPSQIAVNDKTDLVYIPTFRLDSSVVSM